MQIKIGKSYLTEIPHKGKKITFQYPAFIGTHESVAEQMDIEKIKRPNSPETASLVYDAFQNPEGKYESQIIKILNSAWFWEYTGNLYLPKSNEEINNGVILESNPKIEKGKLVMDKESLIKRLNKKDPNVKFVPFGFKIEEQSYKELEKNPYILARYGEEGAGKIAKISSEYKTNLYLWSFDSVDEEKIRMSSLDRSWFSGILNVGGNNWDDYDNGHAFGIYDSKEKK
jgi:hypothetical protein